MIHGDLPDLPLLSRQGKGGIERVSQEKDVGVEVDPEQHDQHLGEQEVGKFESPSVTSEFVVVV